MATRKSTPKTTARPTTRPTTSRPAPTGVSRAAVAPHPKTLANGKPRPTRRGK